MISHLFIVVILAFTGLHSAAQLPVYPDSLFSTYYHQRWTLFKSLPQTNGDIIFLGNSITDGGEWSELFGDLRMKNRGISGDVTIGVLNRINEVAKRNPKKVFLLIGVNDLARGIAADSVVKNIVEIASYLKRETPTTQVFVQSILPVNDEFGKFSSHTNKGQRIKEVNEKLQQYAAATNYTFIDLYSSFADETGKLKSELTNDGLHLSGDGYLLWKHLTYPFVFDLQKRPALLPLPQKLQWKEGIFALHKCRSVFINNKTLQGEAEWLQEELNKMGLHLDIQNKPVAAPVAENAIILQLDQLDVPMLKTEAYELDVNQKHVQITAISRHGIFNGIQTLLQLARDGQMIDACNITDWPAFAWRGYMIDVGRNYMSMDLLKQQIDVMPSYKLNVFHFHATEDIAWRIAVKQYPQLTAPENMMRNKGQYYSEQEIKELIAYCKKRHIRFIPEIDMPGHSAAFRRAMKTDMQTDSGFLILKNILKEFCETYDVDYMHIGADEVKITNERFVPEITTYIQSFGKKVIGWQPGGNFTNNTIRQLWMDDNGKITGNANLQYVDSRHLYINHMDPLESVVTIFNRRIGGRHNGDSSALGGIICMWHDRAIGKEEDVLHMNPVYPAMLSFAERSWKGGGQDGWIANISDGNVNAFREFENRLLDHKQCYFHNKPFPYLKQGNLVWDLYGPYENGGDIAKKFAPDSIFFVSNKLKPTKQVIGGTIVLRHWWAPAIKGAVDEPSDSSTWYAATKIWSDKEAQKAFWIGFNNLSRSPATDSPPAGAWDNKGSDVWVNGKKVERPQWKRPGQEGNPEIPLIDEGYEYREPTKIFLRKGWNTILVKVPVGSFKGKNWQNPVKWMFTFVPLD